MDYGVLAILSGAPVMVTADQSESAADSALLEQTPFRDMMANATAQLQAQGQSATQKYQPVGEFIDRVPTMLLYMLSADQVELPVSDPLVDLETSIKQLVAGDTIVENWAVVLPMQPMALPTDAMLAAADEAMAVETDAPVPVWAISAGLNWSVSEAPVLMMRGIALPDGVAKALTAQEQSAANADMPEHAAAHGVGWLLQLPADSAMSPASDPVLVALDASYMQELADWDAVMTQIESVLSAEAMADQAPLVAFVPVPMASTQLQPWLRDQGVQSIQFISLGNGEVPDMAAGALPDIMAVDPAQWTPQQRTEIDAMLARMTPPSASAAGDVVSDAANGAVSRFDGLLQQAVARADFVPVDRLLPENAANNAVDVLSSGTADNGASPTDNSSLLSGMGQRNASSTSVDGHARLLQAHPFTMHHPDGPVEQVEVVIRQALREGLDRVVIQLDPADLGRVEIKMDLLADGRSQIVITADQRSTLDLLQRDARQLEQALHDAGLDANASDMQFNLNQQSDESQDGEAWASGAASGLSAAEEAETLNKLSDLSGSHYTLSIAQGLDIKV